jgi:glycosyltransferase involved in cell wall biosynthesis
MKCCDMSGLQPQTLSADKAIVFVSNGGNPSYDPRLLRLCAYLTCRGWTAYMLWLQGSCDQIPSLPRYVTAIPCRTPHVHVSKERGPLRKLVNVVDSVLRVTLTLTRNRPPCVWAGGFGPLVLAAPYLLLHPRVRLVYDAREYVLGTHECAGRSRKSIHQRVVIMGTLAIEEWASRRAVAVVHTNRWRRRLYEHSHAVVKGKSFVLENLHAHAIDHVALIQPDTSPTVGYVGVPSANDHHLSLLIAALSLLPSEYGLSIVGSETAEQRAAVMKQATDLSVQTRLKFIDGVPCWELQNIFRTFTCGVVLMDDDRLNNRYCSTNKVFDFIAAGCPVVVTAVPPLRRLVQSLQVGSTVSRADSVRIAAAIKEVVENHAFFQDRCTAASGDLDWLTQSGTVDSIMDMVSR